MSENDKCQKGIDYLLEKYNVSNGQKIELIKEDLVLKIDESIIPLLPWRKERRFFEMKKIVDNATVDGISAMRVCRIETEQSDLNDLIYRELDLCEWILGSTIESIYAAQNSKKAANIIATLKSGVVCTIEVAVTLPKNQKIIDKHEIISKNGVACDRVVDTQVPQQSIYVYSDKNQTKTYQDVDFELFDYDIDEAAIVRQAFEVIKISSLKNELTKCSNHLKILLETLQKSNRNSSMEMVRSEKK